MASTVTRCTSDLAAGKHLQRVDLGAEHQMVLELGPAHDPEATWGFVGVVVSTQDLSASVWRWHRKGGSWAAEKVITIPAQPAGADAWLAKIDADLAGGMTLDEGFFLHGDGFRGLRVHQVRPQGGDASSDSYCYR